MSMIKLGNLSPEQFAEKVGAEFTEDEIRRLRGSWSQSARLTGQDDWHVFDDPAIQVSIGSADSPVLSIFKAANDRLQFNRPVSFFVDERWKFGAPGSVEQLMPA